MQPFRGVFVSQLLLSRMSNYFRGRPPSLLLFTVCHWFNDEHCYLRTHIFLTVLHHSLLLESRNSLDLALHAPRGPKIHPLKRPLLHQNFSNRVWRSNASQSLASSSNLKSQKGLPSSKSRVSLIQRLMNRSIDDDSVADLAISPFKTLDRWELELKEEPDESDSPRPERDTGMDEKVVDGKPQRGNFPALKRL
ncbi:hypothetical protein K503DRAFT_827393 [Rhizopogon vinicolor AM-OR11-026]|uniref:Uncharacterized protein n=1 Tax=Rhizopogon vinicolor AM-OR11-026 TaxID=1314800 RepID=A0A1B7MTL1_9AGAM|nr:hypothetical protein K503DRAFT_827393 [Rhizopogon vinicolor AM-OR11-026]